MNAFHNDQSIKDKYLMRVSAHQKADEIIKGKYWESGKGCAVGCTIHSDNHSDYETELGIPSWLAHLEDRIFEGLPNARAMNWPVEFLEAIKPGQDLDKIKIPFLIFIVESAKEKFNHKKYPKTLKAIDGVLIELKKEVIDLDKLREARRLARTAADAAAAAAAAAADAADAADAAAAAYAAYAASYAAADAAAAYAAYAASYADADAAAAYAAAAADAADAAAAAAYATRQNAFVKFADKLLELIRTTL
jgi:hypothetical protein